MWYFLYILVAFTLIGMLYQDLSYRKIHIALPIILMGSLLYISKIDNTLNVRSMLEIFIFILLNMLGVIIYFSIKNKKFINPLSKYMGLGDIIFLIAVIPLFILKSYMLFFITGMLFSLLLYIIFKKYLKYKSIPLAGYLSLYLGILLIVNIFTPTNLFSTLYF